MTKYCIDNNTQEGEAITITIIMFTVQNIDAMSVLLKTGGQITCSKSVK